MIGPGEIFTLFFVTLGPEKVSRPFAQRTVGIPPAERRKIAVRVFLLSLVVLMAGGWVGRFLAIHWQISIPALLIATGIIFFLVALRVVLEQYEPPQPREAIPLPKGHMAAAFSLTFPMVVTPYGMAALIVLLAATQDSIRMEMIFGIVAGVMVLNLIAMMFAKADSHGSLDLGMRLLGAVLGVLQVALAVQIILLGLQELGIVRA
jgi:multiple antibiotic resistance protein